MNTPRKGEVTRQRVIEQAAPVLNTKGYEGTTVSDLMEATGLQKGGLYRHFATKEELAREVLRYTLREADRVKFIDLDPASDSVDQLQTFVRNFVTNSSPVRGGCPVLNSSVEYDDGNPLLRAEAVSTVTSWIARLADIIREGLNKGTIRSGVEPESLAITILATLEGGVAIGRLAPKSTALQHVGRSLHELLESYRTASKSGAE